MRNHSIQMEIGSSFRACTIGPNAQVRGSLGLLLVISLGIHQPAFAASARSERGATLLLKQSAPVSPLLKLPSEQQIPELRELALANATQPETVRFPETLLEDGHTVRLAVRQRGSGNHDRVLVMIHGVLADHDAWRYVTGELGRDFDLWLIDLPGCGDSDKPDPDLLGPMGYSPTAMAERALQALQQCLACRPQSPRLTIVAHSLGGMTALRMMSDLILRERYAAVLKQIDGMVLLAPCDAAVHQEIPKFTKVIALRGYEAAIGHTLGIIEAAVAESEKAGVCLQNRATRETAIKIASILTRAEDRRAAQAMLRQAVPWREKEHRPDWASIKRLETDYGNIDVPCLIVWGQCDETLPVSMGYKLKDQIAGAKLIVLPDTMHSIQTERPKDCAQIIREFGAGLLPSQSILATRSATAIAEVPAGD